MSTAIPTFTGNRMRHAHAALPVQPSETITQPYLAVFTTAGAEITAISYALDFTPLCRHESVTPEWVTGAQRCVASDYAALVDTVLGRAYQLALLRRPAPALLAGDVVAAAQVLGHSTWYEESVLESGTAGECALSRCVAALRYCCTKETVRLLHLRTVVAHVLMSEEVFVDLSAADVRHSELYEKALATLTKYGGDTGDGRVRVTPQWKAFLQKGYGRITSDGPSLQSLPRAVVESKGPKAWLRGPEGWPVFTLDYRQLELRIAAFLSKDPALNAALQSADVFDFIRARMAEQVEGCRHLSRAVVKQFFYASSYGGGNALLADKLGVTQMEVISLRRALQEAFPLLNRLDGGGEITIPLQNRPVTVDDYKGRNARTQGAASEVVTRALCRVFRFLYPADKGRILFLIHDEVGVALNPAFEPDLLVAEVADVLSRDFDLGHLPVSIEKLTL